MSYFLDIKPKRDAISLFEIVFSKYDNVKIWFVSLDSHGLLIGIL